MKNGSTLFLRLAVILLGLPVLAFCIFLVPNIGDFAAELYPEMEFLKYLVIVFFYVTAIPFYFALYQAFRLLNYIDQNHAFSELSVRALKTIKLSAVTLGTLYIFGMPLFYLVAERDDAPGIILIGMVIIAASVVVAVFAAVLQRLLQQAINYKKENELTV